MAQRTGKERELALQRLGVPLRELSLGRVEREHIRSVMRACDGNRSLAAQLLGIYRRTLQRKLDRLDRASAPKKTKAKAKAKSRKKR